MPGSVLSSRSGRTVAFCTVTALVAVGLVLVGTGHQDQAEAAISPGSTQLVSVEQNAAAAASGQSVISANGRYVAFTTSQSLDPRDAAGQGGNLDVYVRDLRDQRTVLLSDQGVPPPAPDLLGLPALSGLLTVLGGPARGQSANPSISADGRYVAFQTIATDLGSQGLLGGTSRVVVVDRDPDGNGVLDDGDCAPRPSCHQVTQVSPDGVDEAGRALAGAGAPSISAAGDAVAWVGASLTDPNDIIPGDDDSAGAVPIVYRSLLTKSPAGAITAVRSQQVQPRVEGLVVRGASAPVLSGDGKRLALVAETGPQQGTGATTEARSAVLGVDLTAPPLDDTDGEGFDAVRLDVDENGTPLALPPGYRAAPTISGDGRLVAFTAPGAGSQLVRATTWEQGQGPRSELISADTAGRPANGSQPALSASGRYLAFTTSARGLHNGADGPATGCQAPPPAPPGAAEPTSPATPPQPAPPAQSPPAQSPPAQPGGNLIDIDLLGARLSIDADIDRLIDPRVSLDPTVGVGIGRRAPADAAPVQPADPALVSHCDVVVRDLGLDRARADAGQPRLPAELASPSITPDCVPAPTVEDTCEGDDASGYPAISGDGGTVVYESKASTLIPDDRNGHVQDVFARTFQPSLTADPLDFFIVEPGEETVGSTRLHHVGFGPLPIGPMTVSGANGAEFTIIGSCADTTLHAGQTCPASVRFLPAAEGSRRAELSVGYRGSGAPLVVPLIGVADPNPPQAVGFTPDPLAFGGKLPLSTNPPGTVLVQNSGTAPLTITGVRLPAPAGNQSPEDYRITQDECTGSTVPRGGSCAVTVQFSPQGIGERPAVLRVEDNAPKSPHLLALQGDGVSPAVRFDPAVVQVGRATTLFGTGFAPRHAVTVQMPDSSAPLSVVTDPAGNFTVPTVIFSGTRPGERRLQATIDGTQPPITATARLLVVSRPAPPAGTVNAPR